jgi:hypothetical protein
MADFFLYSISTCSHFWWREFLSVLVYDSAMILDWVSFPAYPNLFGIKDFIVVAVRCIGLK